MINVEKLSRELVAAGIAIGGCNSSGVVWSIDGKTEIQNNPDVQAIIIAHTPDKTTAEVAAIARKQAAKSAAALATQLKTVTPAQVESYIEKNVKDLASAKDVLKIMARMVIAMRDEIWPELPEE